MINLWKETMESLAENNLTWDDVLFVAGDDFQVSKENFERVARRTNYDDRYGCQEAAEDLKLYGDGFIMFRWSYDGAEWWKYINTKNPDNKPMQKIELLAHVGETLKDMQEEGVYNDNTRIN